MIKPKLTLLKMTKAVWFVHASILINQFFAILQQFSEEFQNISIKSLDGKLFLGHSSSFFA